MLSSTIGILETWEMALVNNLVSQLNTAGIVSDQSDSDLSSTMIELWTEECTQLLSDNGYHGRSLSTTGRFYPRCGAIYVLYDTSKYNFESAQEYLAEIASTFGNG